MKHFFEVGIAKEYGVNAAVLLENIAYWTAQNEANETNFYDGLYWTFNSRRAFRELFPYMSEKQIYNALQKLIDAGLVVTGNYNRLAYDRTLWYALSQKGKSIVHFDTMDCTERDNGNSQKGQPIPDINTNINAVINTDIERVDYQQIADMYNEICISFPRVRNLSEARKKAIKARLKTYSVEDFRALFKQAEQSDFLKGGNKRNWTATFDWLIQDGNMAKVLDGNYDNNGGPNDGSFESGIETNTGKGKVTYGTVL